VIEKKLTNSCEIFDAMHKILYDKKKHTPAGRGYGGIYE